MTTNLSVGEAFPDVELPDHNNRNTRLSSLTRPSELGQRLGFADGYPLVVVFYRGFFCPRDCLQMRELVGFQEELAASYCKLVAIGIDLPPVQAAFRAGLGAQWTFLSDEERVLVRRINILDETEGEYAYRAIPFAFVLRPDLRVHRIYNGWFYAGRPTLEELRRDLREILETLSYYSYEAWNTAHVKKIRIPQQQWARGAPEPGSGARPVGTGVVSRFSENRGYGMIARDDTGKEIFFHFTAIPGEGYRTIEPGTRVAFEVVDTETGPVAMNVQAVDKGGS